MLKVRKHVTSRAAARQTPLDKASRACQDASDALFRDYSCQRHSWSGVGKTFN